MTPIRILLVEDNLFLRDAIKQVLEEQGWTVQAAENGNQGLQMAQAEKPTLVISDIDMPIMNGLYMTHYIKENPSLNDVPIILVSGDPREQEAMEAGAVAFLLKNPEQIIAQVKKTLNLEQ